MRGTDRGAYARTGDKLLAIPGLPRQPYCCFEEGHLYIGTKSKHRHANARVWRMFWRLKRNLT